MNYSCEYITHNIKQNAQKSNDYKIISIMGLLIHSFALSLKVSYPYQVAISVPSWNESFPRASRVTASPPAQAAAQCDLGPSPAISIVILSALFPRLLSPRGFGSGLPSTRAHLLAA